MPIRLIGRSGGSSAPSMKTIQITCGDAQWLCSVAENVIERTRGLLRHTGFPAGELMLIPRCNMIHTSGMRFPIDVLFIDKRGDIRKIVRNLAPGRMAWGGWATRQTLEAQSGWLPDVPLGSRIEFR